MFESLISLLGITALAILPFALLDLAAHLFGVDSRDMTVDDHTR